MKTKFLNNLSKKIQARISGRPPSRIRQTTDPKRPSYRTLLGHPISQKIRIKNFLKLAAQKTCVRRRKFSQNEVFIVIWASSENQVPRLKIVLKRIMNSKFYNWYWLVLRSSPEFSSFIVLVFSLLEPILDLNQSLR